MTAETLAAEDNSDDGRARRAVFVLVGAQALGGSITSMNIAVSTLAGAVLLDNDAFATLPATMMLFGTMCGTVPASLLAQRFGRRTAFIIGVLVGALGGLCSAFAMISAVFPGLLLGTFLTGLSNAAIQQYRFAAADQASPAFRPKAISWVMAGGILAGIVGPQTAIHTTDLVPSSIYAGCYFAQCVLCVLAVVLLSFLDIPKPARGRKGHREGRSLGEIASSLPFVTAIFCGMCAYSVMSLVMTAAPLAMKSYEHSAIDSFWGIQWHVIAMFAPSFFTGHLIGRFGSATIVGTGFVLLAAAAAIGFVDTTVWHFWISLICLGVGWNFGFIGATTMLAGLYEPEERGRVQALNDLLVFTGVAIASLSSGILLEIAGWHVLLVVSAIPILLSLALLVVKAAKSASHQNHGKG